MTARMAVLLDKDELVAILSAIGQVDDEYIFLVGEHATLEDSDEEARDKYIAAQARAGELVKLLEGRVETLDRIEAIERKYGPELD